MGLPEQQVQPELILRGQLQDLDLETLLSALRLGRQYLTLDVFDAAGGHAGSVSVKSGRVIAAHAGDQTGTAALQQLLEQRDGAEFRVLLQASDASIDAEPLGTIVELARGQVLDAPALEVLSDHDHEDYVEEEATNTRTRIVQGVLGDSLTLDDVLRVVAVTRQHVSVELSDPDGLAVGQVRAKASKILSATAGELSELAALQRLLDAPAGTGFALYTDDQSVAQLQPLGSILEVLALVREGGSETPSAGTIGTNGYRKTAPPPLPRPRRNSDAPSQARILEGSLDEFELSHVLRVLSTSRQHFELHVRDDAAKSVGVIDVKSGFVVGASTEKLSGIAAARELLGARTGRFVAIRRAAPATDRPALVSVNELLQPKAASTDALFDAQALSRTSDSTPPAAAPIPVLDGKLGDLDVASLLRVAAASRQYTGVHIFDTARRPLGSIYVKGGHVVRAKAQDVTGIAAVRRLLHTPRDFIFLVQRYPSAPEVTASIGSIATVLERANGGSTGADQSTRASLSGPPLIAAAPSRPSMQSNSWVGGAVLGAGFVLLGGIASAVILRSTEPTTTMSPITSPAPAPPPAEAPASEPAKEAAKSGSPEAETPAQLSAATPASTLSRAAIASFQAGLRQLGYETGPIDGVVGPRTTAAIKAFQYAEHLAVDGTLTPPTRAVLLRRIGEN